MHNIVVSAENFKTLKLYHDRNYVKPVAGVSERRELLSDLFLTGHFPLTVIDECVGRLSRGLPDVILYQLSDVNALLSDQRTLTFETFSAAKLIFHRVTTSQATVHLYLWLH